MKNKNWKIIFLIVITAVIFSAVSGIIIYKKNNSELVSAAISPVLTSSVIPITTNIITLSLEERKRESAMRGIDWLISQKDITPAKAVVTNFRNIYKSIADEEVAQKCLEIAKEKFSSLSEVDTAIDISDKKYLNWQDGLRPVLGELLQKKCAGKEYTDDVKNINNLLEAHAKEIFPKNMQLSSKLVASYILKKAGLDRDNFYNKTILEIQSELDVSKEPSAQNGIIYLYALTHVVLAESDYFSYYLDPQKYQREIVSLNSALDVFSSKEELSDLEMDIASEILFSLKLFRIVPDEKANKLYQKIIALQNPDGSWGKGEAGDTKVNIRESSVTHHTFVGVLALSDFTPEFRAEDAYCTSAE